jgi:hypothetical protein
MVWLLLLIQHLLLHQHQQLLEQHQEHHYVQHDEVVSI